MGNMWTMFSAHYIKMSVFREGTFYLLPPNKAMSYKAHLFHLCSQSFQHPNVQGKLSGWIFTDDRAETIECEKCRQTPGDNIITVFTLLRED